MLTAAGKNAQIILKDKEYLAIDDVNHRFINTNRKLKGKKRYTVY